MSEDSGVMISRSVPAVPDPQKNPREFKVWIEKTLQNHYIDIKTLFDTTTDTDLYTKLQRDNS